MKVFRLLHVSLWLIVAMTLAVGAVSVFGREPASEPKKLKVVAFGDSTTAPRGPLRIYTILLQQDLAGKGLEVEVINAGVGGDTTEAARKRFAMDVVDQQPDIAIIQFGINDSAIDVWKSPPAAQPRVAISEYTRNLDYFIGALRGRGCKVILMTPNPVRWTTALKQLYGRPPYRPGDPDGFNVALQTYADRVRQIARRKKVSLVDVYAAFQQYGKREGQSVDALLLDGMHPNAQGHQLIADLLIPKILELKEKSAGQTSPPNPARPICVGEPQ